MTLCNRAKNMNMKKKVLLGVGLLVLAYVAVVIGRVIHFEAEDRTRAQVAKIHATKLTLDDVMGKNLPPDPAPAKATAGEARGSVMAKPERISPLSSGWSHCSCCACVPYL